VRKKDLLLCGYQQFIANVKPSADNFMLLMHDGHYCHVRDVEMIEMA
jgi:hypothetical protein